MIDTMIGVTALLAIIFALMALVWIIVLAALFLAWLFLLIIGDSNE